MPIGRYVAEFFIIFVGVWLSLLAENWREGVADSRTEHASLQRMAEDLASDSADLGINLDRANVGVSWGLWILERGIAASAPGDSLARALLAVQFCSGFIENSAEYEALRNSGRLGIIADANLRRGVVSLYESRAFIHSLHARDCSYNETVFSLVAPHVSTAVLPEVLDAGEEASDGFLDSSRPRITSVLGRTALLGDPEFLSRLTELVAYRRFLASQIQEQITATRLLRAELLSRVR